MTSRLSTLHKACPCGLVVAALIVVVTGRGVAAQTAPPARGAQLSRGGMTVSAIASSLSVDGTHLNPDVGGDGPNRLGVGVQASAQLWMGAATAGIEASTASLSWTDSRPRSLGPATEFSFRESVGLLMGGFGFPRQAPVVVLKGGIGIRTGSVEVGESSRFADTSERNTFVVAVGADLTLAGGRVVRPVITVRYIRAARSEQEQSAGLGAHTFRVGVGVDLGRR